MIGPFKPAPGGYRWVYVIIDKFSKWIEYKPLVSGTVKKAAELLDEIIHRFGLPNSIITNLGSTFTGNDFWNICDDRGIVFKYVLVAHLRANGQAERTNGMIHDALKKRLYRANDKHPGRRLKELQVVVWGLRTQPSRNTDVSPYFMVFSSEAMLQADIAFQSPWVKNHDEERSSQAKELKVNCAKEHRLDTCACMAKYLEGLRRYYNRNVKDRFFVVGDLVL
jgi:transposase InsO family protein